VLSNKINYKFPTHKGVELKSIVTKANPRAINLIEMMLNFNPVKRPTPAECLQHPFFQCFDILYLYGLKTNPLPGSNLKLNQDKHILTNPMKVSGNIAMLSTSAKNKKSSNKLSKFKFEDIYNLK
jgi:serine/threonine protein kinase